MKSVLKTVEKDDKEYQVLAFVCPGCALSGSSGLHQLPVNTTVVSPSWTFDGNLEAPTISPSIKTTRGLKGEFICHSFLIEGVFQFLGDCTHELKNKHERLPDLPDWVTDGVD